MKKSIFFLSAAAALFITGCRKIEADGEKEIVIINQGGTGTTGQTITLTGRITADTILRKANKYILKGLVYMAGNKTMTIEAGTTIEGSYSGSDVAALIITRGSKIVAQGTANEPVVFTSNSPNKQSGDWGGLVICGKANINGAYTGTGGGQGVFEVEGGVNNAFGDGLAGGGTSFDDNDSSGVLSYVRIEYAGYAFQPDKEINSLTLAAVGRKTVIDHVQVTYAKDDAFEWFGGTVNAKYLIAWKTQDDDFDTDYGYTGKVQFGLVVRDSLIADQSGSEAFESDNNPSGTVATPKTAPIFSNITAIGPKATLTNIGNSNYVGGAHIRRNSALSIYNSVLLGWPIRQGGIFIDNQTGEAVDKNIADSSLRIRYTTLAGNSADLTYRGGTGTTWDVAALRTWFLNPYFGNTVLTNTSDAKLIQPFNYSAIDPTPFAGSNGYQPIYGGGSFTDTKLIDPFFTVVNFRGAIAPAGVESTWWKGWTAFK